MHFTGRSVPWKIAESVEHIILQALLSQNMGVCSKFPDGQAKAITDRMSALWNVNLMLALNRKPQNTE
jgi:hypothetical protein